MATLEQAPLVAVPTHRRFAARPSERRIQGLRDEISKLEDEIEHIEDEIEHIEAGEEWPTRDVLLAVYGAPGNWPCEAAA